MTEVTMETTRHKALGRLLTQLGPAARRIDQGEDPDVVAEEIWPDFVDAVRKARGELAERRSEGLEQWRKARHSE